MVPVTIGCDRREGAVMAEFEYGPAEFLVARFDGDRPSEGVVRAIAELLDTGTIRLLDLVIVRRHDDGRVEIIEPEELGDDLGLAGLPVEASGLAAEEDAEQIAELLDPGSTGAILVLEHLWARQLSSRFFESGGVVLLSERIPAPVVNAVAADAYDELDTAES